MSLIYGCEAHSFAWTHPRPGAHVARAVLSYLWNQGENGICCPMGMTFASIAGPSARPGAARRVGAPDQSARLRSAAGLRQGQSRHHGRHGDDGEAGRLRSARHDDDGAARDGPPRLRRALPAHGHKWFFSVPMSDLFLTLAQTDKGLSCFLATGWLPDGSRNRLKLQRLKDKCGNKSNASSEVEFHDLHAVMLGDEGRGIRTIIEMAHATRLDFAIGSSGLMRQALSQAIHHTTNRRAFQRGLIDLPIMRNVVADLAVESEAMMWMSMRLAAALDRSRRTEAEALCRASARPWQSTGPASARRSSSRKRWNATAATATSPTTDGASLPRSAAERHLGGNRQRHLPRRAALDAARAGDASKPSSAKCPRPAARMRELDAFADDLGQLPSATLEPVARRVVEMMAFALQASLLVRYSTTAVADAFCATRLDGDWGRAFGTLPHGLDTHAIVGRARIGGDSG